jgi:hypothetical protein
MGALFPDEIAYPLRLEGDWVVDTYGKPVDMALMHPDFVLPFSYLRGKLVDADCKHVNPEDWYRAFGGCAIIVPVRHRPGAASPGTPQTPTEEGPSPQDP